MNKRVAIIGAGNFGQALAFVLRAKQDMTVEMWDKDPAKVPIQRELPAVIRYSSIVFVCVPSWALRSALESIRGDLTPEAVVISPAKGIDNERLTVDQLLEVVLLMGQPWALLSGPMIASEMLAGQLSFAALAAKEHLIFEEVRPVFSRTTVRLAYSSDPHGVALAGVLKNVYAVGLGAVEALGLGHNVQGSLVMQSCLEMAQILQRLGGHAETAWGLAGVADLVATGFSEHSRNCRVGKELVKFGKQQTESEGVSSLPHLKALVGRHIDLYPVLAAIDAIVEGTASAQEAIAKLLAVRYEREKV
ncbi:MAG: NAD(P)-binding domain-containing protein [Patescibacteria group bacterium]